MSKYKIGDRVQLTHNMRQGNVIISAGTIGVITAVNKDSRYIKDSMKEEPLFRLEFNIGGTRRLAIVSGDVLAPYKGE